VRHYRVQRLDLPALGKRGVRAPPHREREEREHHHIGRRRGVALPACWLPTPRSGGGASRREEGEESGGRRGVTV
jgi:hypothetical protein